MRRVRHLDWGARRGGRLFTACANFKWRRGVTELVALPILHDQLQPITAGRQILGQRQAELNVEVSPATLAAVVYIGEFAAAHAFAFVVENLVRRAEKRAVALLVRDTVVV